MKDILNNVNVKKLMEMLLKAGYCSYKININISLAQRGHLVKNLGGL